MKTRINHLRKRVERLNKKTATGGPSLDDLLTKEQLERLEYARKMRMNNEKTFSLNREKK
jgi:hypothetical protein